MLGQATRSDHSSTARLIPWRRAFWVCLVGFVVAGIVVRVGLAILSPSIDRPDEVYQNIEPAYRLWTGQGVVTWEWREGIRSWVFPGFIYAVMQFTSLVHLPDKAALPLVWTVLAVISSGCIAVGVAIGWRHWGLPGALLCGILTAFWPDLVYYGPKTLAEVQAGHLLVIAAGMAAAGPARQTRYDVWRLAAVGLLLGFAFDLRFQLAVSLALVACWAARFDVRRSWAPLALGAALPILILGIVDALTWGSPFQSIWKNVQINLLEHKAEFYGTSPLLFYVSEVIARNGSAVLLAIPLFLYGVRSAPLMGLTAISVVVFHSLVAHKEVSFIYAALPCAMITVGLGAARLVELVPTIFRNPVAPNRALAFAVLLCFAVITTVAASERPFEISPRQSAMFSLWGYARAQPDLCGLGLFGREDFPWADTMGYAGLRRNVPMYLLDSPAAYQESKQSFNYLIGAEHFADAFKGFDMVHCAHDYCLFHQPIQCQPTETHEISHELQVRNQ